MQKAFAIIAVLILALIVQSASASTYYNGYRGTDGYTYYDGYWYWGNDAYTRTRYYYPGYWSCGIYYPGYYYYTYSRYYPPAAPAYTPPTVNYTDSNWRSKLLDIAAYRDKVEGQIRKSAFEQQYFVESVKALGLTGNFNWQGYGTVPPYTYPATASHYSATIAVPTQGTTLYGYSYNTIAQLYGDTNLTSLYQQASQLAQGSQKLAGDAAKDFNTLVGVEGRNRANVAEILAKGQMAEQIIKALRAPSTVETKGYSFRVASNGQLQKVENNVDPVTRATFQQQFAILAQQKCAGCHSTSNKRGGFDVSTYTSLSPEQKQLVWQRLTTDDPKLMMPKNADGSPGQRLTSEELRLFVVN